MHRELGPILATLDALPTPTFVIEIQPGEHFVFRGFNDILVQTSGFDSPNILGKAPHDVFPKRIADALVANYTMCLRRRARTTYEEVLDLPNGKRWWHTELAPVFHGTSMIGILGCATDWSHSKETEQRYARALETMSRLNAQMAEMIAVTASNVREPLVSTHIAVDMVLQNFTDLGDNKKQMIEAARATLDVALERIDACISHATQMPDPERHRRKLDFGHWCRNTIALFDPAEQLGFLAPDFEIECETFVFEFALMHLLEAACRDAKTAVSIDVSDRGDMLQFVVRHDGAALADANLFGAIPEENDGANLLPSIITAAGLIKARGGEMWYAKPTSSYRGRAIAFCLPGTLPAVAHMAA